MEEQKKILQTSNQEFNSVRTELPGLVQKIQESELTKGVY